MPKQYTAQMVSQGSALRLVFMVVLCMLIVKCGIKVELTWVVCAGVSDGKEGKNQKQLDYGRVGDVDEKGANHRYDQKCDV